MHWQRGQHGALPGGELGQSQGGLQREMNKVKSTEDDDVIGSLIATAQTKGVADV